MSYQNIPNYALIRHSIFRARLTSVYALTSGDVGGGGNFPGMVAGTYIYGFKEQSINVTTGLPADANPGRESYPTGSSMPNLAFAVEVNNNLLTVPGSTPTGYANPGPYVWLRQRETVNSVQVYEFDSDPSLAWVKVTSITSQSVNLAGGGTLTVYPAKVDDFSSGSFSDETPSSWWYEVNGQTPTLNNRYQCRLLGMDTSAAPVWATSSPSTASTSTFSGAHYTDYSFATAAPSTFTGLPMTGATALYDIGGFGTTLKAPASGYYHVDLLATINAPGSGTYSTTFGFVSALGSNTPTVSGYQNGVYNTYLLLSFDIQMGSGATLPPLQVLQTSAATVHVYLARACIHQIG